MKQPQLKRWTLAAAALVFGWLALFGSAALPKKRVKSYIHQLDPSARAYFSGIRSSKSAVLLLNYRVKGSSKFSRASLRLFPVGEVNLKK